MALPSVPVSAETVPGPLAMDSPGPAGVGVAASRRLTWSAATMSSGIDGVGEGRDACRTPLRVPPCGPGEGLRAGADEGGDDAGTVRDGVGATGASAAGPPDTEPGVLPVSSVVPK